MRWLAGCALFLFTVLLLPPRILSGQHKKMDLTSQLEKMASDIQILDEHNLVEQETSELLKEGIQQIAATANSHDPASTSREALPWP